MTNPGLARRLGFADAVFLGIGSMLGAGVFVVFAPAAQAAGSGLLIGLAIAAVVAFCNATSSAQLAAAHPTSGGAYAYGRAELGPWWGFAAGWAFVIGKTASCAAMALAFAAYAVPAPWQRPVAAGAVVALAAVNWFGITRTALLTRVIVIIVVGTLVVAVAAGTTAGGPGLSSAAGWKGGGYGILQSAGLLFFAFAGYARIATMGEEVKNPSTTIPRAIVVALTAVVIVYTVVGVTVLAVLGPAATAASVAPVADVVTAAGWGWAVPVVAIGAACASLGALLALLAGIGRTTLAMAREGDLPRFLSAVHPRWQVPHRAEAVLAVAIVTVVALTDIRTSIGFSSFGVLLYYLIANVAAFRQQASARRYPRTAQVVGAIGCVVLAGTLPLESVLGGAVVVAAGLGYRWVRLRLARGA